MGLEVRIKELVAIGASVTANCQPCLRYHVDKAAEDGVDSLEIAEAIQIGKLVRKGAAHKMDQLISVLQDPKAAVLSPSGPARPSASAGPAGCGSGG
jgi:AhpD family alkylhydroperoxidase